MSESDRERELKKLGSMMDRLVAASDTTYENWLKDALAASQRAEDGAISSSNQLDKDEPESDSEPGYF